MIYRTVLPPKKSTFTIAHNTSILCIGSCFAEHIGLSLKTNKFDVVLNPFGIIYNPLSISQSLELLLQQNPYGEDQLFEHSGLWHSFDFHSIFSHPEKLVCLHQINKSLEKGHQQIINAEILLITLGTAFAYKLIQRQAIVANNHKLPPQEFEQICISQREIVGSLSKAMTKIKKVNPQLKIILTVSPVRHIRNGLINNTRSKARLILACEQLENNLEDVHYFPAYELLTDDLRDYRFYKADMIHPNQTAINYIWDYFKTTFFDIKTISLIQQITEIVTASQHRPFHMRTLQHQLFVQNQLRKISHLEKSHSFLNFEEERTVFEKQRSPTQP